MEPHFIDAHQASEILGKQRAMDLYMRCSGLLRDTMARTHDDGHIPEISFRHQQRTISLCNGDYKVVSRRSGFMDVYLHEDVLSTIQRGS